MNLFRRQRDEKNKNVATLHGPRGAARGRRDGAHLLSRPNALAKLWSHHLCADLSADLRPLQTKQHTDCDTDYEDGYTTEYTDYYDYYDDDDDNYDADSVDVFDTFDDDCADDDYADDADAYDYADDADADYDIISQQGERSRTNDSHECHSSRCGCSWSESRAVDRSDDNATVYFYGRVDVSPTIASLIFSGRPTYDVFEATPAPTVIPPDGTVRPPTALPSAEPTLAPVEITFPSPIPPSVSSAQPSTTLPDLIVLLSSVPSQTATSREPTTRAPSALPSALPSSSEVKPTTSSTSSPPPTFLSLTFPSPSPILSSSRAPSIAPPTLNAPSSIAPPSSAPSPLPSPFPSPMPTPLTTTSEEESYAPTTEFSGASVGYVSVEMRVTNTTEFGAAEVKTVEYAFFDVLGDKGGDGVIDDLGDLQQIIAEDDLSDNRRGLVDVAGGLSIIVSFFVEIEPPANYAESAQQLVERIYFAVIAAADSGYLQQRLLHWAGVFGANGQIASISQMDEVLGEPDATTDFTFVLPSLAPTFFSSAAPLVTSSPTPLSLVNNAGTNNATGRGSSKSKNNSKNRQAAQVINIIMIALSLTIVLLICFCCSFKCYRGAQENSEDFERTSWCCKWNDDEETSPDDHERLAIDQEGSAHIIIAPLPPRAADFDCEPQRIHKLGESAEL